MTRGIITMKRLFKHVTGLDIWMNGPLDKGQHMIIKKGEGAYTVDVYDKDKLIETQAIWTGARNWRIYASYARNT